MSGAFHRYDSEYWTRSEWSQMPDDARRIALALGPEPLADESHRLAPLPTPPRTALVIAPPDAPPSAAQRARLSRSVELRLMADGAPFAARAIWRALMALGLRWGDLDLFHWHDPNTARRIFSVHAAGQPGYFLPERAAEGERIAGIVLFFEPPLCPAPEAALERLALTVAHLRETLGGIPLAGDGTPLDSERLDTERARLARQVDALDALGLWPGSAAAARWF
jgi:cell division protein ZipA